MSTIRSIIAKFECEGCGEDFTAHIDPAWSFEGKESAFDMAIEAVHSHTELSVQGEMALCANCTRIADNIRPDDTSYQPTRDEILHATGAL